MVKNISISGDCVFSSETEFIVGKILYDSKYKEYGFAPYKDEIFDSKSLKKISEFIGSLNEIKFT